MVNNNNNGSNSSGVSSRQLVKQWNSNKANMNAEWQDRIEWMATSFLSMTPATHMILLRQTNNSGDDDDDDDDEEEEEEEEASIEFWLGATGLSSSNHSGSSSAAAVTALQTIKASKGGRIALPSDHPVAVGLLDKPEYRKCVIVQRIPSSSKQTYCWVVASNDLLASFTQQDLQWLGRMAEYVKEEE